MFAEEEKTACNTNCRTKADQRSSANSLFTLSPVSLSLLFMFCTSLFLGYLFSFDFFFFPPTSLSLRMPKKKKKPLAGTNSPAALRTRNVSVRCHCVPAGRGRRTDERRRAPQTKQRLTQFTKLREPARQGCLEPFLRREAPPCCVDQQEQPSDINVLMPSTTPSRPAPMSFSPIHHPQPARLSWNFPCAALQSSPWFLLPWVPPLAGLLPQISREPTKLLLQRPPLLLGLAQAKRQGSAAHHAAATSALHAASSLLYRAATGLYRAGQGYEENTICGRFKNSAPT